MNKTIPLLLIATLFNLNSVDASEIRRYKLSEWNEKIGYSQAVAVGDTLYFSGIVSSAPDMEACLSDVLHQTDTLLKHFDLPHSVILKEKIYTNDKDALRQVTNLRKAFYGDDLPVAVWIVAEKERDGAWIEMELVIHIPEGHVLPEP